MASLKKRRIFVTGANGFVGANLVRKLLTNNYDIHILNHRTSPSWRLKEVQNQIITHRGDITDYLTLKKIVHAVQPEYVIHLAAYGAYHFQTELDKIVNVNSIGTKNLLEATKDIPYKCFINTGSSSEYGYNDKPMKETDSCNPVSYYAATKLGATQICKVFAHLNNKPIITFRLFSVYGPYEEPTRLIPVIMNAVIKNKTITLAPGIQRRDFIYVADVCEAYLKVLKLGKKLQGETVNIGTGREYSNDEIVQRLFAVTKRKTHVDKGSYPKRSWDTTHWRANMRHTKKLLQWRPISTIDKGLQNTYSWFVENSSLYQ